MDRLDSLAGWLCGGFRSMIRADDIRTKVDLCG